MSKATVPHAKLETLPAISAAMLAIAWTANHPTTPANTDERLSRRVLAIKATPKPRIPEAP